MTEWVIAVAAVIFHDGKVLAMRRSAKKDAGAGLWETLSGRVEPYEQPCAAVARETQEECGLDVAFAPTPVTAYVARRNANPMLVVAFAGLARSRAVVMSAEHDAYAWVTPEEFARLTTFAPLAAAVSAAARQPLS